MAVLCVSFNFYLSDVKFFREDFLGLTIFDVQIFKYQLKKDGN